MAKACPTCGGTYDTVQRGGTYLHACAPVLDKVVVQRAGALQVVAPGAVLPTDQQLELRYVERPNKVDETISPPKG